MTWFGSGYWACKWLDLLVLERADSHSWFNLLTTCWSSVCVKMAAA